MEKNNTMQIFVKEKKLKCNNDRQQNSVKQLSFNKKNRLKNIKFNKHK